MGIKISIGKKPRRSVKQMDELLRHQASKMEELIQQHNTKYDALVTEFDECARERDRWAARIRLLVQRINGATQLLQGQIGTDAFVQMLHAPMHAKPRPTGGKLLSDAQRRMLSLLNRRGYEEGLRNPPFGAILVLESRGLAERDPTSHGRFTHWRITEAGQTWLRTHPKHQGA